MAILNRKEYFLDSLPGQGVEILALPEVLAEAHAGKAVSLESILGGGLVYDTGPP